MIRSTINWIFFGPRPLPVPARSDWRLEKPWGRGTFAEGMKPLTSMNYHGTFCKCCGDWVTDSAYYSEHRGKQHAPCRGSWNWLHPEARRRGPDDLKPGHDEWLEEIRDFADRSTRHDGSFSGTGPSINPNEDRAFHSEEEARRTLEPLGCRVYWCSQSGWVGEDGVPTGQWSMAGSRKDRLKYEQRSAA